jgi:hypothetical protein
MVIVIRMDAYDKARIHDMSVYLTRIIVGYVAHDELINFVAGRPYNFATISEWHGHDTFYADVVYDSDRTWGTIECILRYSEPRFMTPMTNYLCTPAICALTNIGDAIARCHDALSQNKTHSVAMLKYIDGSCLQRIFDAHVAQLPQCAVHSLLITDELACAAAVQNNMPLLKHLRGERLITVNVLRAAVAPATHMSTFQWIHANLEPDWRGWERTAVTMAALTIGSIDKFRWLVTHKYPLTGLEWAHMSAELRGEFPELTPPASL